MNQNTQNTITEGSNSGENSTKSPFNIDIPRLISRMLKNWFLLLLFFLISFLIVFVVNRYAVARYSGFTVINVNKHGANPISEGQHVNFIW